MNPFSTIWPESNTRENNWIQWRYMTFFIEIFLSLKGNGDHEGMCGFTISPSHQGPLCRSRVQPKHSIYNLFSSGKIRPYPTQGVSGLLFLIWHFFPPQRKSIKSFFSRMQKIPTFRWTFRLKTSWIPIKYSTGLPQTPLKTVGKTHSQRQTIICPRY